MGEHRAERRPARAAGRHRLLVNAAELLRQPGAHRTIDTSVPLADLDIDDPRLSGEVAIAVAAVSTLDDIEVSGTLTVDWADECARCLRPLAEALVIEVDERYAEPSSEPGHPDDPEAFPIEHGQIDLAAMVREEALLGVPDAPVCCDDCPGLCPICGTDLTDGVCGCAPSDRDERWAVLDQLKTAADDATGA